MLEQFQKSKFPESSLGKYFVFEGLINFFNCHKLLASIAGFFVLGGNDNTICTLSDDINDFISAIDLKFLFGDDGGLPVRIVIPVWFVHADHILAQFDRH